MKKRVIFPILAAVLCGGAATGAKADRLNLWPLVSVDDGAVDVLWPIVHYRDSHDWRVLPFMRSHHMFAIVPEVWVSHSTVAALPVVVQTDFSAGTVFPVAWWDFTHSGSMHSLFPLYYRKSVPGHSVFWAACGLAGWDAEGERRSHWALPFYAKGQYGNFYSIPYTRTFSGDGRTERYLCGLAGRKVLRDGRTVAHWCLPLWHKTSDRLLTLPLRLAWDGHDDLESWSVPLLLTGYRRYGSGSKEFNLLLRLGGLRWGGPGGWRSSWLLPFYYEDSEGTFITPLAGKTPSSHWVMPLYYANGKTGTFATLPYGHVAHGGRTSTWWLTPLVGTHSGTRTGGWLFPLFNRMKDVSFDRYAAWMDAGELPDEIQIRPNFLAWTNRSGEVCSQTRYEALPNVHASIAGSVLLLSDQDRYVRGWVDGGRYRLRSTSKHGNRLVFNRSGTREVLFDCVTRQKAGEEVCTSTTALLGLFQHTSREKSTVDPSGAATAEIHTRTRLLWKLWDRRNENGDVTVDAFPALTYDSRTNGYSKTSFFWRLFRYEHDPEKGTAVDVLFIPVWR